MNIELNNRSQMLMKMIVERYIREGQPVASKALSQDLALSVSPATVRNVMKQLEDLGLICSPHTSAGRVPTELGYRFYVDTMLNVQPLQGKLIEEFRHELSGAQDSKTVVHRASSLLSEFTHMAGVVMVPRQETRSLRQIEFLPLSGNQLLAILVINNKEVQNKVITTDRQYTPDELSKAANYLNQHFAGKDIREMCQALQQEMTEDQEAINNLMDLMVSFTGQVAQEDKEEDLVVEGQANLIGEEGISSVDKLKQLFDAFSRKRDIAHLLDRCVQANGVQIFIGQESGYEPLGDCSVVTAPYHLGGESIGVLGVIGPTRMSYDRVVPVVDLTAKLLSAALSNER